MGDFIFWEHDYSNFNNMINIVEKYKEYELNEHGKLVFKHKTNKRLFLERAYKWVNNLILLDETEGRQIIMSFKFTDFDFSSWEPITKNEYDKIINKYREIYD